MKIAPSIALGLLVAGSLTLAGCGSSEPASEGATADTVELPAEEAMSQTSAMPSDAPADIATPADLATPGAMATIVATDEGMDPSAAAED